MRYEMSLMGGRGEDDYEDNEDDEDEDGDEDEEKKNSEDEEKPAAVAFGSTARSISRALTHQLDLKYFDIKVFRLLRASAVGHFDFLLCGHCICRQKIFLSSKCI